MLQYERIDVSEGIDVNKTNSSKECYWFFKDVGFKFEEHVCNGCHDLLTMALDWLIDGFIKGAFGGTYFRDIYYGINEK